MKKLLLFAAVVGIATACAGPSEAPPLETTSPTTNVDLRTGPSRAYTMEELLKTVSVRFGFFSPDESRLLVSSNETGVYNLYVIDIATGERTAVTEGDETTYAVGFFPNDERILFARDFGGNEVFHLFVRDVDGAVRDLTGDEKVRERFFDWAWDLESFFTISNRRDEKFMDLYERDLASLEPALVYQNELGLDPRAMSPDKRWLALSKVNTMNHVDLLVLDLADGGEPVLLSTQETSAKFDARAFSADSRYLYYTANAEGEFAALYRYELATGEHEQVFATDWDVSLFYSSRNDTYQAIGANEDGYTVVRIVRTTSGEEVAIPDLPAGTVTDVAFSRSERLMRFHLSSDTMPGDLWIYDLETGKLRRLTDNLNPEIDPGDLVAGQVARFAARDGLEIPGPLYKPIGAGPDNRVPVLVWVHGGPGGQSRAGYRAERQFLINHGYGVFSVNNRGSSGYGKSFFAADDGRHGKEPLWDTVDAKGYLQTLDWVDPDRIGIIGGSYGGYMVLAALAFEPEEFAVGVDIFGVANWLRTLQNIPPWWESFREALYVEMGNPETDEQMLHDISPVFFGGNIVRPLIILQGANDPRVLQAESDDMVAAIRAAGGTVEYLVFDDEGHGFTKSANRIEGYNAVLEFLDTHLEGAAPAG